ncbi:MAG: site-2 protease family protein [Thermodesulfovibrio sp.]|nr:site-2 protease family protein [Thermodesulfovibrio sp.]MDW7999353.1 site-2 protease family protein [Thermodesulfovibrio sp.]
MNGFLHGSWQIARILGIPIRVHFTWLIVFGLITWSLSTIYFPRAAPQLSYTSYWINGILAAFLLFLSVAIHEIAHCFMAMRYKLTIESITLFIFGGVAQIKGEPPYPKAEFKIAIAGPATSFLLSGIFFLIEVNTQSMILKALFSYLSEINLILGSFNLIPGFPMDGGRVLRAYLWKKKANYLYATQKASTIGQKIALLFVTLGIFSLFMGTPTGLWLILIGWFLYSAAYGSYQQSTIETLLKNVKVKDIMITDIITISPTMKIQEVIDNYFLKYGYTGFPVVSEDKYLGILALRDIKNIPEKERSIREVSEFYGIHRSQWEIMPEESALNALERMISEDVGRLVILDSEKLKGMITRNGISKYLEIKLNLTKVQ